MITFPIKGRSNNLSNIIIPCLDMTVAKIPQMSQKMSLFNYMILMKSNKNNKMEQKACTNVLWGKLFL